ncbi:MAG: diacylglycerol kinase family lipid kinase [Bacteroidales bacterium]|nr:diacylglycerol kinase family lipid kinase [Bacteroidales bacterium]
MKKRILFIVNPIAGHHRKGFFARSVKTFLDIKQYDYTILHTEYAGHGQLLAEQGVREGYDIVAAVGGDGTINEVAKALIGTETALAIIAYGSGNGLARSLHLPLLHINAIKLLNTGKIHTIDTASVNGIPFVSIAGIGLDAQTAYDFSNDPRRGFLPYARYALENYIHFSPQIYTLTFDGQSTLECSPLLISFANANQFGYNAVIAPHSDLADGLLNVCILNRPPLHRAALVASQLLLERLDHSRYFTEIKAEHISVHRPSPAVVNIDGEPMMFPEDLDITIRPSSLRVMLKK